MLVRLRWCHGDLRDPEGRPFVALTKVKKLRVGQVGEWPVELPAHGEEEKVVGRVVAVRLPAPVAAKSERRARRIAAKKGKKIDPRTVVASRFVMLFTTIPARLLDAASVLALYRYRWQVEVAFKRLKQLLHLGNLPHKGGPAARSWILAKLVLALLIEKLFRNAKSSLPWGYPIEVNQEPPG
ncbi:MAG: transposase [Planctomycetes bacterium]|nr:transposase [Planctomycetota bacterium]